jgi:hypothetical protein
MAPLSEFPNNHPHWTEFIIGVSVAVAATAFVGFVVWLFKWLRQSTSLRIGAGWTSARATDPECVTMHPNVSIVSRPNAPRKIVHSIWVRESKNIYKPGTIYGKIDLADTMPVEKRTTGGDLLSFVGPTITCSKAQIPTVMRCAIWIQTTDNTWYKAQSMGNPPKLAERLRLRVRR